MDNNRSPGDAQRTATPSTAPASTAGAVPAVDRDTALDRDQSARRSGETSQRPPTVVRTGPVNRTSASGTADAIPVTDGRLGAMEEAHRRAGGIDGWATVAGTLAALGAAVVLGGLLTAAGAATPLKDVAGTTQLSIGGAIGALVILLVAFYIGGLVAGRMARYDGARNGLVTAVWFLVIASILGAVGAKKGADYNVLKGAHVPGWVDRNVFNGIGILYALSAVLIMFAAAFLGGKIGARWHRDADQALLTYPTTTARAGHVTPAHARR